jgi:hypothetical protein
VKVVYIINHIDGFAPATATKMSIFYSANSEKSDNYLYYIFTTHHYKNIDKN